MKVTFSEHALKQMAERNISENEIIYAMTKPDNVIKQTLEKFQAVKLIKRGGKKYLIIVIYRKINSSRKVIAAFLTNKIKKYLRQ